MTWEIVAGIITIALFLISFGTVLAKLIRTLTALDVTIKTLQNRIETETEAENKIHENIFRTLGRHGEEITDHETRITILEHDKGERNGNHTL